jgi:N-acetylmuramoyl-L-alanine amidase
VEGGGVVKKIALDAGHGQDNSHPGVYDPGAVSAGIHEADVVLLFALELEATLLARDIPVFMTRINTEIPCPVGKRASRAKKADCTHLVSLHCNSAASHHANGIEVLYREEGKDKPLARKIVNAVANATGLKNRGVIKRTDLAVLKFTPGPAVLIELGFLSNKSDREKLHDPTIHRKIIQTIADILTLEADL